MTWLEFLSEPKTILSCLGSAFLIGGAWARLEFALRSLKGKDDEQEKVLCDKNEHQARAIKKVMESIMSLETLKLDRTDCDIHLTNQRETASRIERQVVLLTAQLADVIRGLARVEGVLSRMNGNSKKGGQ